MPALNEAQRKRQRMLQQQQEEAYRTLMRPKAGQKGQQTSNVGSSTKGETIGGAKRRVAVKNPTPAAKIKEVAADEARTPKVEAGKGDPEFRRPKPAEVKPAKPAMRAAQQPTTATKAPATSAKPDVKQSGDMGRNYEAWTKANRKLAEKVKPGQAGYDAIQKALGKSSSTNSDMKIKPENKTDTAAARAQAATESTKSTSKAKPQEFNTRNVIETLEQRRRRLAMEKQAK